MCMHRPLLFLVLVTFCASVSAQVLDPEDEQRIDEYIEELMECRGMPGYTLALVGGGQVLMAKGYGLANVDTEEAVSPDSLFAIASVSKSFTATLLAKVLAETDGIDWDTPVRDILGEDFYLEDGYRSNQTTYRDLLAHKTGIPRNDAVWTMEAMTRDELVMGRIRFFEPVQPVRTSYIYNNVMYAVAGQTVEVLTGQPFEDALQQLLLIPLGMDSTTFYDRAAPDYEGFVTPYYPDHDDRHSLMELPKDTWRGSGIVGPAATVCSSANDMALWLQFVLSGGATSGGDQLVDPSAMDRLWQAENAGNFVPTFAKPEYPVSAILSTYALGYLNGYYREYSHVVHDGSLSGYESEIAYMPDMDFGIFASTNYGNQSYENQLIRQFVEDIMLGEDPWTSAEEACQIIEDLTTPPFPGMESCPPTSDLDVLIAWLRKHDDHTTLSMSNHVEASCLRDFEERVAVDERSEAFRDLESYEGQYGNFGYGNLTVFLNETTELLELQYGGIGRFDLHPTEEEDRFMGHGKENNVLRRNWPIVFTESTTGSGVIDEVTVPLMEIRHPPTFLKGLDMADAPPPRIHDCT